MHRPSHYQDLLGSEGPDYGYGDADDHGTPTQFWSIPGEFHTINPLLDTFPLYDMNAHCQRPGGFQNSCISYDQLAQGFSHRPMWDDAPRALPQLDGLGLFRHEFEQGRHQRHLSPTDPFGFALSSNSDSSGSDYALSPDATRNSLIVPMTPSPQGFYATPLATSSVASQSWTSQPLLMSPHPSTPVPATHTIPSMRQLQVTPDPEQDDEPVDAREAFHSRIDFPSGIELSAQLLSPPDSGPDQPVHDDEFMKDEEEDSEMNETDTDSDFRPRGSTTRGQGGTARRHSLRGPRRPTAVIDPKARVQKSAQVVDTSHNGRSRSKIKKKALAVNKDESDSKHFPCAFHHYGCCAMFGNKNEWKRHVNSQHIQLGYYRCDMGTCSPKAARTQHRGFNDFNRKDLFTQHCRRMHAPWSGSKRAESSVPKKDRENFEAELEVIRARCWVDRRKGPQKSKCGFCGKKFADGKESLGWDERMEHVGRHFEKDHRKSEDEVIDDGLQQWAISEGIVREGKNKGEFWLVGFEPAPPSQRPRQQRRSRRSNKEAEVKQEDDESPMTDGNHVDTGLLQYTLDEKHADRVMESEDNDGQDEDAEAEDDE
ncbi:hypothetical protein AYO21_00354 [Fonsecaea monophora]|uniref:C2H2-type domain-containing protein n=1 Tax=Fonsecaea monophora TaxID=254056 RepID=A0A177FN98_9EURO|nr:hypothetical protein AYO21_00354 [Fonsecaea monophora]KAH0832741.1 putative C2H2 finger domain protein [Fonsecaea pedrosoi]OAG45718.1 hypothetical protein AYO21_00354 [Fonsecaea monophora]